MPLMPILIQGKLRLANLPAGADSKDQFRAEAENTRRAVVARRRLYYGGEQYDLDNLETMKSLGLDPLSARLPEHERLHAYSTQIGEAIDFLTDQLCESFALEADDPEVQQTLDDALRASDQFSGPNDDDEIQVDDIVRDALIAGDVAVELRWDPLAQTVWYDVWESEQVEFHFGSRRRLEEVVRQEIIWVDSVDGPRQVVETVKYTVEGATCMKRTYHDEQDQPVAEEILAVPFIPWALVVADKKGLRATRGESTISDQAMQTADRYNAVEQVAYLIARYNSHGNLAVVGDAAALQAKQEERISKDIADVLTFPGGTAVQTISLQADTSLLQHQKDTLAEALFASFGLTRVDMSTVGGLGGISGYALEILNRKTEGTFRRVRRSLQSSLLSLFSLTLDMTAVMRQPGLDVTQELAPTEQPLDVSPELVFPNRKIEIRMGSGYIVDDVMVRDDFVAKIISRKEALRRRGYSNEEIDTIETELESEAPPTPEVGLFGGSFGQQAAGSTVGVVKQPAKTVEQKA